MPRPTMHKGKTLLAHIDSDEKKRIEAGRPFRMPNYRSGDVMEVTMFQSLSEGHFNTFKGIVYSNKKRNNLRAAFKLHTIIDDVPTGLMIKECSPMLAKVDMVRMGSNQLRKKLNHIPDLNLSKGRLSDPIVRGRNYKQRTETRVDTAASKHHD